jgi:subtilisin family serine protease
MVQQVQYNLLDHPDLSQSYKVINATGAWAVATGGRASAGKGVKIGDIDTGIDQNHPFFDPSGFSYPDGFPRCDAADSTTHTPDHNCKYVSPKVIVAKVFYNKVAVSGLDAQAVQDHGTHTAGIAAGVTGKTAVVQGGEHYRPVRHSARRLAGQLQRVSRYCGECPQRGHPQCG